MKLFLFFTLIFTLSFFAINHFIVGDSIQEQSYTPHIEIEDDTQLQKEIDEAEDIIVFPVAEEKRTQIQRLTSFRDTKKQKKIIFLYKPEDFQESAEENYKKPIFKILNSKILSSTIEDIVIILYQNKNYVRGNMKNKVLRLYNPDRLGKTETVSVFVHELGHYIDLYYFRNKNNRDISHDFYSISWETTKIQKAQQTPQDFISGYAATNSYEDFSESFTYYMLHNKDFLEKSKKSDALQQKYSFFQNQLFPNGSFIGTDFSSGEVKNYYRDITKINFSLDNFLEYLEKNI